MIYKFFGEPNMLVKTRKRVPFEGTIIFKPLFRFDEKGEYETDDEELAEKLKTRFDHVPVALESSMVCFDDGDCKLPIEGTENVLETNIAPKKRVAKRRETT